jgi:hypothetical protein
MTLENDFDLIKKAVQELSRANDTLQQTLTNWSETITDLHRAELNVRGAHRGVLRAQNLLTAAINNSLGDELMKR